MAPVALGKGRSAPIEEERSFTCILCQAEEELQAEGEALVMAAFVQGGHSIAYVILGLFGPIRVLLGLFGPFLRLTGPLETLTELPLSTFGPGFELIFGQLFLSY